MREIFTFFHALRIFFLIFSSSIILFLKPSVCQRVHLNFIYDYNIARYLKGGYEDFVLEEGDYEVFIYDPDEYPEFVFEIPRYEDIIYNTDDLDFWMRDFPDYEQNYFEFAENPPYEFSQNFEYEDYNYDDDEYGDYEYGDYEYDEYEYDDYQHVTYKNFTIDYNNTNGLIYTYYSNSSENHDSIYVNRTDYLDATLDNMTDFLYVDIGDSHNVTDDHSDLMPYNVSDYFYPATDLNNHYLNWTSNTNYNVSSYWKEEQLTIRYAIADEDQEAPVFEFVPDFPIVIDDEELPLDELEVY